MGVALVDSLGGTMAGDRPLVSVVVPAYNAEKYLRQSLDSILAQTYPNLEVIVADDASTDGTAAIARAYGDRIHFLRRERNLGQFANVEEALTRTKGEFACVFHADDVYDPEIVEREANYLVGHPELTAVFCLDRFIDAKGTEYGRLTLPPEVPARTPLSSGDLLRALMLLKNRFLRTPGAMVRADVYARVGSFREDLFGHAADLDMWLRIARLGPIAILDEHLYRYRHTPESAAHTYLRRRSEVDVFFELIEVHLEETGYIPPRAAWAAFLAHREEDRLLVAVAEYVRGHLPRVRRHLAEFRLTRLWRSGRVARTRMTALYALLAVLSRLRRIEFAARAFRARWGPSTGAAIEEGHPWEAAP